MNKFDIIAHRGITTHAPENTLAAFQRALDLHADAVEMDIHLTADHIPVVYHYYYLKEITTASGLIFDTTLAQLREVEVHNPKYPHMPHGHISTLEEILDLFAGKIGLEIEIKGPEPEAPEIIGEVLLQYQTDWPSMEITSYEPALLLALQQKCPGITCDFISALGKLDGAGRGAVYGRSTRPTGACQSRAFTSQSID